MQDALDRLINIHRGCGIVDFQVFAKPRYNFSKERISTHNIVCLFELSKNLYPEGMRFIILEEGWDELDIYRHAEEISQDGFASWMNNELLVGKPIEPWQQEQLEVLLKAIAPLLGQRIILYHMVDDNNHNCDFAPYIFIGDRCLIVVAERWEL